eukprot:679299-Rhodomonas_salina.1
MPGTELAYSLRACYGMSSTDLAHAARYNRLCAYHGCESSRVWPTCYGISVTHLSYDLGDGCGMSGTELGHGFTTRFCNGRTLKRWPGWRSYVRVLR